MKTFFTREVKIGLTGIVALIVLYSGIKFLKGASIFDSRDDYYITFSNAKGLSKSSTVFADGFDVGVVSDIQYDFNKPGQVVVTISVDGEVRIPKGSSAELSEGMLGGCTLNLLLSNNMRERYEPGDTIKGNDASGLMDMAANVMPDVQQVLQRVDTLVATLNMLASNENLPIMLENARLITENLNRSSENLNHLLSQDVPVLTENLNTTLKAAHATLNTANGTIAEVGDHVNTLTTNLDGQVRTLTTTLNNKVEEIEIKPLVANLNNTVSSLNGLSTDLQGVVGKMSSKDNTLGLLLNDTVIYGGLNATLGNANNLLIDLKEHPKRYVHFSLFGKKDK